MPAAQWSPGVEPAAVDDEASLLVESSPVSPPFVRAPLEDRSKYEKLAFNADDLSSDSDKEIAQRNEERMKKKRRRVKGVLSRRKKDHSSQDPNNLPVEYESDDSIGSASDLKAINDEDCAPERDDGVEKIDETISESVRTCGSSAYHAECESVATHEDDHRMRKPRKHNRDHLQQLPTIDADPVVGHQYGEKPLLLDDELDTEAKPEQSHGDPFVGHQYASKPLPFDHGSSSDNENGKTMKNGLFSLEEDVFALAPFTRPTSSRKSSASRESGQRTALPASIPNSPPNISLVTPISSSPVISGNLVDIESESDVRFASTAGSRGSRVTVDKARSNYENVNFEPVAVVQTPDSKDLFGSSPFSSTEFVNPFSELTELNYPKPESIVPVVTTQPCRQILYSPDYINIGDYQLAAEARPVEVNTTVSSSKFGTVTVNSGISLLESSSKDLFGSIPFDEFASLSVNSQQRPTSLPLSQSPAFVDSALNTILSTSAQSSHSAKLPPSMEPIYAIKTTQHTARITVQTTNSVANSDVSPDIISPMSPEPLVADDSPKHKKDKSRYDKSKYHLMNENRTDNINVLTTKIAHKSKGVVYKKTPKTKKSGAAATAGFSNMSFEDFPSDENDERSTGSRVAPFEVIREPEKRFGSLKRRSNPFT